MVKKVLFLMLLTVALLGHAQTVDDKNQLACEAKQLLVSWLDAKGNQQEALMKLSIMHNRGELANLPCKKKIFDILIKNSDDELFLHQSILFLSKFDLDNAILLRCKHNIHSRECPEKELIASLSYLSEKDLMEYNGFFEGKNYLTIDNSIKRLFYNTSIVKEKRDLFLSQALMELAKPAEMKEATLMKYDAPLDNNHDLLYNQLLKEAKYVPIYINTHKKDFMTPTLPLVLLYLLGEIHSSESFELLLDNYLMEANFRSAITLACCTGSLQLDALFNALINNGMLNQYLKDILINIPGNYWDEMTKRSPEEQLLFYKNNYEDILLKAIQRAKPIRG